MSTQTIEAIADQLEETADALKAAWSELPAKPPLPDYSGLDGLPNRDREARRRCLDEQLEQCRFVDRGRELVAMGYASKAGNLILRAIDARAFPADDGLVALKRALAGEKVPLPDRPSEDPTMAIAEAISMSEIFQAREPWQLPRLLFTAAIRDWLPLRVDWYHVHGVMPGDYTDAMRALAGELRRSMPESSQPDAPADADERPTLTELQALVLDIIGPHRPRESGLTNSQVLLKLDRDKKRACEVSTLTKHVWPVLKQHYGVMAKGPGYYRP